MNNSDMPAMPALNELAFNEYIDGSRSGGRLGMTKREYFAGLAMQGIASDADFGGDAEDAAALACDYADELLAQLERTK